MLSAVRVFFTCSRMPTPKATHCCSSPSLLLQGPFLESVNGKTRSKNGCNISLRMPDSSRRENVPLAVVKNCHQTQKYLEEGHKKKPWKQPKTAIVVLNLKAYRAAGGKVFDPSAAAAASARNGLDLSGDLHTGTYLVEGFTVAVRGRLEEGVIPAQFFTKAFDEVMEEGRETWRQALTSVSVEAMDDVAPRKSSPTT